MGVIHRSTVAFMQAPQEPCHKQIIQKGKVLWLII